MAQKRVPLRGLAERYEWNEAVDFDENGGIIRSAAKPLFLMECYLDTIMRKVSHSSGTLFDILQQLKRIAKLLTPTASPKPVPVDERAERVHASRRRAMELYVAAGGVVEPGDEEPGCVQSDLPIRGMGFSVRASKAFYRLKIETLGQLLATTADELLAAKNFGATSLNEVRRKLASMGLALAGDPQPEGA